jgi:hypothetical protein
VRTIAAFLLAPLLAAAELAPQTMLTGVIEGGEGNARALLVAPMTTGKHSPGPEAYRYVAKPLPVGENGRFAAPLPPGRYRLTPVFGAQRWTTPTEVELPRVEDLRLVHVPIRIRVRDERGTAVGGATVRIQGQAGASSDGFTVSTGAEGIAAAWAALDRPFHVTVHAPGHFDGTLAAAAGTELADVVLTRAGQLVARLAEPALLERCHVELVVHGNGLPQPMLVPFDRSGACRIPTLAAGEYRAALQLRPARRHAGGVPLLVRGERVGERAVQIVPGATAPVEFPPPRLARVTGVARVRGEAIAGVSVFVLHEEGDHRLLDDPVRMRTLPRVATDGDGRVVFDVAAVGPVRLFARHPDAQVVAGPYMIAVDSKSPVSASIDLPTSSVRGWFDLPMLPDRQRGGARAHLVPRGRAHEPIPGPAHDEAGIPACRLSARGEFDFAWIPAGDWIVRIVDATGAVWAQEPVRTDGRAEARWLRLPREPVQDVMVRVAIDALPPMAQVVAVVWRVAGGGAPDVFWGIHQVEDGVLTLAHVPAGDYRLEFVQRAWPRAAGPSPVLAERALTVRAEGTATPAELR